MKRLIYAAIAVTIILTGCKYHPFYDGQAFGVYAPNVGLIRTDGTTINVPIVDRSPYVLEFYGGMGIKQGAWRNLTEDEVRKLMIAAGLERKKK